MKKSGVIIGVLLLFILSIVTAQPSTNLGTFEKGSCVELTYSNNVSSYANISAITYPLNSSYAIYGDVAFTDNGNGFYNYSFCNTQILGTYNVYGHSDIETFEYYFKITPSGIDLTTSEALIYVILTLAVFLIFALSFYIMLTIPYSNESNEKGAVIKITKAKYFKLLMIGVTYSMFVWLLNILIGVSDNFVSLSLYYGFISFLFTIFLNLTIPVFAVIFVIGLFEIIRDANIYQEIKTLGSALR
jgi:hypothetical protein